MSEDAKRDKITLNSRKLVTGEWRAIAPGYEARLLDLSYYSEPDDGGAWIDVRPVGELPTVGEMAARPA